MMMKNIQPTNTQFSTSLDLDSISECPLSGESDILLVSLVYALLERRWEVKFQPTSRDKEKHQWREIIRDFARESEAHKFVLSEYRRAREDWKPEKIRNSEIDQVLRDRWVERDDTEYFCPLVRFLVDDRTCFDDEGRQRIEEVCFVDLGIETQAFPAIKRRGQTVASLTPYRNVAALNLALAMFLDLPIRQHLGKEGDRYQSGKSGTLPGCLGESGYSQMRLVQWVADQEYSLADSLPLFEAVGEVCLLTNTWFLQRDEVEGFRRKVLEEEALVELVLIPEHVFVFDNLDQRSSECCPHVFWRFSFRQKFKSFNFVDSQSRFTGLFGNWDLQKGLDSLRECVLGPDQQEGCFEVVTKNYRAPKSMIRIADFRQRPSLSLREGERIAEVGEFFELVLGEDLLPKERVDTETMYEEELAALFEEPQPEIIPRMERYYDFDYLIRRRPSGGRLVIQESIETGQDLAEYFGLKLRNGMGRKEILGFLLSGVSVESELAPYFHGEDFAMIAPQDFVKARMVVPSESVVERLSFYSERNISSTRFSRPPFSEVVKVLKVFRRSLYSYWPDSRAEDDWGEFEESFLRRSRREFERYLERVGHKLRNDLLLAGSHLSEARDAGNEEEGWESISAEINSAFDCIKKVENEFSEMTQSGAIDSILAKEEEPYSLKTFLREFTWPHKGMVGFQNWRESDDFWTKMPKQSLEDAIGNIVSNASIHGGKGSDLNLLIELTKLSDGCRLSIGNNGVPFPRGLTTERYLRKGEFDGATGRTGLGGFHVQELVGRFGSVEIEDRRGEEYPVVVAITLRK